MEIIQNYINGKLVGAENGQSFDNYNPSNGQVYGQIPDSTQGDIQSAVDAASTAFPLWSATTRLDRSNLLLKIADLIDANHDRLAAAESKDNGKPIKLASRVDIPRASANFRFFATAILHESTEASN